MTAENRHNRRRFLSRAGLGCGLIGSAALLADEGHLIDPVTQQPLRARTHHAPTANAVIWLFMNGGPSPIDTWDHKPALARYEGRELPNFDYETGFFPRSVGPIMRSPFQFRQHGESGAWVSEIYPHLSQHIDKMAFLHACWTDSNNHAPALFKLNTGTTRQGWPSWGSWLSYGLGSLSRDLPAFLVMSDPWGRGLPKGYSQQWSAGFLPATFQGSALPTSGAPFPHLALPPGISEPLRERQLDLLRALNAEHRAGYAETDFLDARMESFELAHRMQMSAPEVFDLSRESASVEALYGLDDPQCAPFGRQCLQARRLVEQGVRCIQIYSGGTENEDSWDAHKDIGVNHRGLAEQTDRPIAGLLADLEARGLLDSTLVIWGGEFGRLPIVQKGGSGRDHNPHAFTMWFAGGGVRGGTAYGTSDEFGYRGVTGRVSVPDLHATILHLMGLDHERLTFRFSGRNVRLTDVSGAVIHEILG